MSKQFYLYYYEQEPGAIDFPWLEKTIWIEGKTREEAQAWYSLVFHLSFFTHRLCIVIKLREAEIIK